MGFVTVYLLGIKNATQDEVKKRKEKKGFTEGRDEAQKFLTSRNVRIRSDHKIICGKHSDSVTHASVVVRISLS
jgi:hypothetical protein